MSTASAAGNVVPVHGGFADGSGGMRPARWRPAARAAQPMATGAASGHDCDAVVVGGGPAGAAAAARLATEGFTTVLVDRAIFPRDKVCGDFVGPAALSELANLGVTGTEAFSASNAIGDCALHVDGDQLGVLAIPQVGGLPAYGRVIPRLQLDAWILDAARHAGATVLDGRKVTAIEQASDAVTPYGVRCRMTGRRGPPRFGRNTKVLSRVPSRMGTIAWKAQVPDRAANSMAMLRKKRAGDQTGSLTVAARDCLARRQP